MHTNTVKTFNELPANSKPGTLYYVETPRAKDIMFFAERLSTGFSYVRTASGWEPHIISYSLPKSFRHLLETGILKVADPRGTLEELLKKLNCSYTKSEGGSCGESNLKKENTSSETPQKP